MKINQTYIFLLGLFLGWLGWEYAQEQRMAALQTTANLCNRVERIESMMLEEIMPLMVDVKVALELNKSHTHHAPIDPSLLRAREEAEKWADDVQRQYHMKK